MKTLAVILKNAKEVVRNYKILLLSLSMGPFFIFIYYLITSSSTQSYTLLIVEPNVHSNQTDSSVLSLTDYFQKQINENAEIPFQIKKSKNRNEGLSIVSSKKADALIVVPENFSTQLQQHPGITPEVEFVGDLTNTAYLLSAVYANEMLNKYAQEITDNQPIVKVHETALGQSGNTSEFNTLVPGILIVSIIMLMFTASIAFVSEIENKTILRLQLSKLKATEYLGGITAVQTVLGIISLLLTLFTAQLLGFESHQHTFTVIIIAALTSISIISFSLIIAAFTKSASEVLVVGNFPMFLFMFFSGAAFPLKSDALFSIAGYPISLQGLMSPTHAISALNKSLILNASFTDVLPELIAIVVLSLIYFVIGAILFKRRHFRVTI